MSAHTAAPIGVTFGTKSTNSTWIDRRTLTWSDLAKLLTTHTVGQKDGTCIVPALLRGSSRKKEDADTISIAMLDSDTGVALAELADAVRRWGWAGAIHSTHSHMTTTTRVRYSNWRKYQKDHPEADAASFLTDDKQYLPHIAAGASVGSVVTEKDGEFVYFSHQPCPKFRVVVPLLHPWRATDYPSQNAANEAWKERIEALAHALGLQHDQSCTDTSRLFYLPRRPANSAPPESVIIAGSPCDLFALPPTKTNGNGANGKAPHSIFGTQAPSVEFVNPDTGEVTDLKLWAAEYGQRFLIADALRTRQPSVLTGLIADNVKAHIRCPNESQHTNAGTDAATFVINAGQSDTGSFVIHCRHNHCTGLDRLLMVKLMLEQDWLSVADLTDKAFLQDAEPEQGEEGTNSVNLPPAFSITAKGVWYKPTKSKDDSEAEPPLWLCAPFQVLAETADETGGSWGLLLSWQDRDHRAHQWAMPRKLLHLAGNEIAAELEHAGLAVGTSRQQHDLLKRLLSGITTPNRRCCVPQTGWHRTPAGIAYVMPAGDAFGPGSNSVILQSDHIASHSATEPHGTLDEWKTNIARLAVGNHRLGLFISAAFAPPLLDLTSDPTGGLHIYDKSQSGKTTLLNSAASVWGCGDTKGYVKTWRATSNGMEGVAAATCDGLLPLDELGMVDPREAGEIVYSLANQSGKARAARDGSARARLVWRLLFLSTGEIPLDVKMGERGITPMAGQEVRLANLPADAGAGLGVFQQLHEFTSADRLADHLRNAAKTYYGTASRAFIEWLANFRQNRPDKLIELIKKLRQSFNARAALPADADGQAISVARRFSLIAAAGELAQIAGILPWPKGEATIAAVAGLHAWIEARGGTGAGEDAKAVAMVRRFIEQHGESRFTEITDTKKGSALSYDRNNEREPLQRVTINRVGFRRDTSVGLQFLIMPESWKSEVCKGLDPTGAAKALHAAGFLDKGEGRNWQKKHRLPDGQGGRYYTIKNTIISDDTDDDEDDETPAPQADPPSHNPLHDPLHDPLHAPLDTFIRDCCTVSTSVGEACEQTWRRWCAWCRQENLPTGTPQTFEDAMLDALPDLEIIQPDGASERYFSGIGLKT